MTDTGHAIPARQAELVHLLAKAHTLQGDAQQAALSVCVARVVCTDTV